MDKLSVRLLTLSILLFTALSIISLVIIEAYDYVLIFNTIHIISFITIIIFFIEPHPLYILIFIIIVIIDITGKCPSVSPLTEN